MRSVRWFLWALIALFLLVFAIANRQTMTVDLWPFPVAFDWPVCVVVLITLAIGFLVGELVAWLNGHRWRREARRMKRRVEELERELAARAPTPAPNAPASTTPALSPPRAIAPTEPH